jgi:hypothetical protein
MSHENCISFSTIKEQVGKKNVIHAPSKWIFPTENQTEDEFHTSDEIPYGIIPSTPDSTSFSTITKQVNKKKVSKKSKRDRIAEKSVLLADRLEYKPYK